MDAADLRPCQRLWSRHDRGAAGEDSGMSGTPGMPALPWLQEGAPTLRRSLVRHTAMTSSSCSRVRHRFSSILWGASRVSVARRSAASGIRDSSLETRMARVRRHERPAVAAAHAPVPSAAAMAASTALPASAKDVGSCSGGYCRQNCASGGEWGTPRGDAGPCHQRGRSRWCHVERESTTHADGPTAARS